jgi:hypothetical protein
MKPPINYPADLGLDLITLKGCLYPQADWIIILVSMVLRTAHRTAAL